MELRTREGDSPVLEIEKIVGGHLSTFRDGKLWEESGVTTLQG